MVSNKIYSSSNEYLDDIFMRFNFTNKDVLTVLASSDQFFCFCSNNVKRIDTFDINYLAVYYYFLRIWTMKYNNLIYPIFPLKRDYLDKLLILVNPNSALELEALDYWNNILKSDISIDSLFNIGTYPLDSDNCDISSVLKKIDDINFSFYNIDISNNISINNKYDIIYVSNISDYVGYDNLKLYRDNLYSLLNSNGIVMCSNVGRGCVRNSELSLFEEKFKYYSMSDNNDPFYCSGYYYVKKDMGRKK